MVEETIVIDERNYYFILYEMYKSHLILISDQDKMGIGNVTLSSPSTIDGFNSIASSYNLFGTSERLLSKIISEKASNVLKTPVLLLLFLKNIENEEEIIKEMISSIKGILSKIENKNQKT
ncbi:MAG: hypothetical protein ACFFAS_18180 [Promethearchaeota archaeon]